jgi:hypothetical protein
LFGKFTGEEFVEFGEEDAVGDKLFVSLCVLKGMKGG